MNYIIAIYVIVHKNLKRYLLFIIDLLYRTHAPHVITVSDIYFLVQHELLDSIYLLIL